MTLAVAASVQYTSLILWRFCLKHPDVRDVCDIGRILFGGSQLAYNITAVFFILNNTFIQGHYIARFAICQSGIAHVFLSAPLPSRREIAQHTHERIRCLHGCLECRDSLHLLLHQPTANIEPAQRLGRLQRSDHGYRCPARHDFCRHSRPSLWIHSRARTPCDGFPREGHDLRGRCVVLLNCNDIRIISLTYGDCRHVRVP